MFTVPLLLPVAPLTLLLALTALTYLWSGDPGRRARARTIMEIILRAGTADRGSRQIRQRRRAEVPADGNNEATQPGRESEGMHGE